jgi:hypothetical protein
MAIISQRTQEILGNILPMRLSEGQLRGVRACSQIRCGQTDEVLGADLSHYCAHLEQPISKRVEIFSPIHACLKSWNDIRTVLHLSATLIISIFSALKFSRHFLSISLHD